MFKLELSEEDVELIKKYSPISYEGLVSKGENAYEIDQDLYVGQMQDDIDAAIVDVGMIKQERLNNLGRKLQKIYDRMFVQEDGK